MRKPVRMAFRCFLLLSAFASLAYGQTRTIILIRHADKVSNDYDSPLNENGFKRAKCLADTLADARIEQIFTSDLQRTQQTAAPLADRLQLKPVGIPFARPDDLIVAVRSTKATTTLVVWHGGTLPKIVRALGGPEVPPITEPEYDHLFVLTLGAKESQVGFVALRYCDCAR